MKGLRHRHGDGVLKRARAGVCSDGTRTMGGDDGLHAMSNIVKSILRCDFYERAIVTALKWVA